MEVLWTILILIVAVILISVGNKLGVQPHYGEGAKRAGRIGLWLFAPPLGLWRSWRHGQEKRDIAQADRIAAALNQRRKSG